jgi:signal transduction histidine kinase
VRVDRPLVLRVIMNLLTNAREALAGSGTISVSAWVDEGVRGKHRALWVSVTDTGRGMSEEFVRTQLFKPFATTKATGLGVGLAQCRNIVEAHGGHIDVESELGRGTTFRVCLPITSAGRAAPSGADGETHVEVARGVADVARGAAR